MVFSLFNKPPANGDVKAQSKVPEKDDKKKEQIKVLLEKANNCYEAKDYIGSFKAFVNVLKVDKFNAIAQYSLGYLYEFHTKGANQDAVRWYTAAAANGHKKAEEAIAHALGSASTRKPVSMQKKNQ